MADAMAPCHCDDIDRRVLVRFEYGWTRDPANGREPAVIRDADGVFVCEVCHGFAPCEFSFLGEDHPATHTHIDYVVCEQHMDNAVDCVADRRD